MFILALVYEIRLQMHSFVMTGTKDLMFTIRISLRASYRISFAVLMKEQDSIEI